MKKIALLIVISFFSILSVGCSTMEGLGEDIEKGGEVLQDKANENK